jgi:uncharacterized membrane protein YbaN (DUF454 family)
MLRYTQMILWRVTGVIAFALGLIGLALPIVPTVPFMLVAAWAASKGWPRMEQWLLNHPRFGEHIRAWRERGIVPRKAKVFATLAMTISALGLQFSPVHLWARIAVPAVMIVVAIWLWTRPENALAK